MQLKAKTTANGESSARPILKKSIVEKGSRKTEPLLNDGEIYWAVNPFETDIDSVVETLKAAGLLNKKKKAIRPVAVVSPVDLGWPITLTPSVQKKIHQATVENIEKLRESPDLHGIAEAEVVVEARATREQAARALLGHIGDTKTRMIVLNTHGRRGLRRFRLGSFTEMLLSLSPFPVLVAGPECVAPSSFAKVFFPTDLSEDSQKIFSSLVAWAREEKAHVVLYHIENPLPPASLSPIVNEIWDQEVKALRKRARSWAAEAKKAGVPCEVVIERRVGDIGAHSVEAAGQAKADLIVMSVRATPWEQTFFGHNTRQILAEAECPVLVVKSPAPKEK